MKHNDNKFRRMALTEGENMKAFNHGYLTNLAIALMVLHDKFDFTDEQLQQFIDDSGALLDSCNKSLLTFEDICNTLHEETGITIKI